MTEGKCEYVNVTERKSNIEDLNSMPNETKGVVKKRT